MNYCSYCYKELDRHIFCSNSCRTMFYFAKKKKGNINNRTKCEICGWDATPCDRHRLDSTKKYCKENVVILCPNCHRTATMANTAERKSKIINTSEEVVNEINEIREEQGKPKLTAHKPYMPNVAKVVSSLCKHGAMMGLCRFGCK